MYSALHSSSTYGFVIYFFIYHCINSQQMGLQDFCFPDTYVEWMKYNNFYKNIWNA
jgi:hypothetical protein